MGVVDSEKIVKWCRVEGRESVIFVTKSVG